LTCRIPGYCQSMDTVNRIKKLGKLTMRLTDFDSKSNVPAVPNSF